MSDIYRFISIIGLIFSISVSCYAKPRIMDTIFPTDDIVIATAVVDPPHDASTDAAPAIQSAIDQVSAEGGGVVYLPAGKYRINGHLFLRRDVTLRGDWAPPTTNGWQRGTILMPTVDRGNSDAIPAIRMLSNCGVRNLTIWYPDQNAEHPVPYPWSISTAKRSDDPGNPVPADMNIAQTILNVTLVNSYKGITIGITSNLLHVIRNVYGTPLKTGIAIDTCVDVGRTQNVDFRPDWWENSGLPGSPASRDNRIALHSFMMHEGTALDLGRDEWGNLYDLRIKGYAKGLVFRTGYGASNGVVFRSQFVDCGTALELDDVCQFGIGFTGCQFSGKNYAVYAPASFYAAVQFNSCVFNSKGNNTICSDGTGTLSFQNCDFQTWQKTALELNQGSLTVMGSIFRQAGEHITLGKNVKRAIILSNKFMGKPSIVNHAQKIDLQVSHRQMNFAKPDISLLPPVPNRLPGTRKLFIINDFGASPSIEDNTAAFKQAFEAARKAGGGTVYVPAGAYRFKGEITVPSGVELRGCFDVPHHTVGAGSALLPFSGKGNPKGTPFIRLQPGSGLRGLTIWYPEQDPQNVVPFPWTVQGLGPGCWIVNLNCGNAYQGVDFWTYPSNGHMVKYLSGAYFNKGLFISKCKGDGWVDDLHFNPHFSGWVDPSLEPIILSDWPPVLDYVRSNLDAIVFGSCEREHIKGTFVFGAFNGLAFRDDNGGTNARVIHHGTDNGARCAAFESSGTKGIELIGSILTPVPPKVQAGIITDDSFAGKVSLFNTMMFSDQPSTVIGGKGRVLLQQLYNMSGVITLKGGNCTLENSICTIERNPQVRIEKSCESARLIGNISPSGVFEIKNEISNHCCARANSLSTPPPAFAGQPILRTGWEDDDLVQPTREALLNPAIKTGVSNTACTITSGDAHSGIKALRLTGSSDDPQHGYVYYKLFDTSIAIYPDTILSYWIKPLTAKSIHTGIDLTFSDGSNLRASGTVGTTGEGTHPTNPKGQVGEWKQIIIPLGRFFMGKTINDIMFAYDGDPGAGPFDTLFDDLSIESKLWDLPWEVTASPSGGIFKGFVHVELKSPETYGIRYTLDGTPPGSGSLLYTKPIMLDTSGLHDLRYVIQAPDGRLSNWTFGQLYDVTGVR